MLSRMDLRRAWPTLGLVVLLVLDLVLVLWALWPSSPAAPARTPSRTATATPTATPTASASSGAAAAATPRPLTRLVVAVGRNAVWAVDVGTCAEPGAVHVSDDRGRTWASHSAPGSVTRVRPDAAGAAFVVGGTRRCQYRLWTTSVGGTSWNGPRSAAATWGRDPKDARVVQRPGGAPVRPCPGRGVVLDLAAVDASNATALCGDGTLRRTTDGGAGWSTSLTREGGAALALSSPATGVVVWVDGTCDGVVVGVLTDGALGAGRCVEGVAPAAGEVAVGIGPSGVWLTAGDAVLRADAADGAFTRVSDWPTG